ncbi:MAG TPA: NmrA family NAD(P)-binding protein, partial [Anaerolineales bacterium]|nr:NmrA family NAD(P)-binding protein [Anaerolineales bacterium]
IRHLLQEGYQVRTLLRPSRMTPELPKGLPVEVALSSIQDERSLRVAVAGVDTIYHLVGAEWRGAGANLSEIEIQGTNTLLRVAEEAGVRRIVYLSHLDADRASAFPMIKIKGIVEEFIRRSSIPHTILRTGLVFGENDHFTTGLTKLMAVYPLVFFLPGTGDAYIQPLWVEDLATCLTWLLDREDLTDQTVEIGGPEFLTIQQVAELVMEVSGIQRMLIHMRPSYLRIVAVLLEYLFPNFPQSITWIDYLANDRITSIDSVSRNFGLLPARMATTLDYLKDKNWGRLARQDMRRRTQKDSTEVSG